MIIRRKEYAKREPSRDAHKIYIVCEGKGTEPAYFSFFEGLSSNLQLITIPPEYLSVFVIITLSLFHSSESKIHFFLFKF